MRFLLQRGFHRGRESESERRHERISALLSLSLSLSFPTAHRWLHASPISVTQSEWVHLMKKVAGKSWGRFTVTPLIVPSLSL